MLNVEREMAEAMCDSPIERLFLTSLIRYCEGIYGHVMALKPAAMRHLMEQTPERQPFTLLHMHEYTVICPQFPVGRFRVDFSILRICYDVQQVDRKNVEILRRLPLVVVECDGHDFHEKTKQQAARDKSRDRELQVAGYRVLHFTGSEIVRDSLECVMGLDRMLQSLFYGQA